MIYKEEQGDLFDGQITSNYAICLYATSNGLFDDDVDKNLAKLGAKDKWCRLFPITWNRKGTCIDFNVNNLSFLGLLIKRYNTEKTTLDILRRAFIEARKIAVFCNLTKIAVQKLDCAADNLSWDDVREVIKDVFNSTNIEILVRPVQKTSQGNACLVYKEEKGDLFDSSVMTNYTLCHCISADFALGAGIARGFAALGVKDNLQKNFPSTWNGKGYCLFAETVNKIPVANLVTKKLYNQKPTLDTMRQALEDMREQAVNRGLRKIAMPTIGCGLDRLNWIEVRDIIRDVFANTNIEILVRFRT